MSATHMTEDELRGVADVCHDLTRSRGEIATVAWAPKRLPIRDLYHNVLGHVRWDGDEYVFVAVEGA